MCTIMSDFLKLRMHTYVKFYMVLFLNFYFVFKIYFKKCSWFTVLY